MQIKENAKEVNKVSCASTSKKFPRHESSFPFHESKTIHTLKCMKCLNVQSTVQRIFTDVYTSYPETEHFQYPRKFVFPP